jgi:RNA polymerase sigma-70 factor, ECF subfamily
MDENTSPSLLIRVCDSNRDQAAWNQFVSLYTPLLFHWTKRAGLQPSDAAELVQEVFVTLLKVLPSFRYDPNRSFRAWLSAVIRSRWADMQRRRARLPDSDEGLSGAATSDDFLELEEDEFRKFLVQQALQLVEGEVGPTTISAFRRTAIDDRPAAEVAAELNISENAVYLARRRVMQRLREHLDGMWDD